MRRDLTIWIVALSVAAGAASAQGFEVVRDGEPRAALVIDSRRSPLHDDATDRWEIGERAVANIASTVVEYVRKSTGATLSVVDLAVDRPPTDRAHVYIGRSRYVDREVGRKLDKLDPSGYLIRVVDDRHLIIAGPTSEGTEFGTFEFLERFVGVRWLFPTEVGDYVPEREDLVVPSNTRVTDEPAFMQVPRVASRPTHRAWARRMRFWTRLRFHHNLSKLLDRKSVV